MVVRHAVTHGIEKGRNMRIEATVTETNIHAPADSSQLFDGVRVATRLLTDVHRVCGFNAWSEHTRRAKRRLLAIQNATNAEQRKVQYRVGR